MSDTGILPATASIATVIVLYKRKPAESEAFSSHRNILEADPELARHFSLVLYDNSPEPQHAPGKETMDVAYVHDPSNGGLAPAYNFALQAAERAGAGWLLLMDQDTMLTREFLVELVERAVALAADERVAAIVPKLVSNGLIYSPEQPLLYQMRHQFARHRHSVEARAEGVQSGVLNAFNSGAALRVSALRAIGGFPVEYWLDYLDHAVFHALSRRGYRVCVMRAVLEQKLSHMDLNTVPMWRHLNHLTAQSLFVVRNGSLFERLAYRLYLLRVARMMFKVCRDKRVGMETLLQAVLLRTRPVRPGGKVRSAD